ncbi:hypothetical protein CU041_15965 [Thalassospira povalilytica]|uniref:Intracellular septation protein A n=1 Tax=Thalassospira povalilytica TaxID=732237 RepID=A0ABX4R658_9PROT|nr:hypothetical protein CU041_15965 [Thalassospira povalilytica]
MKHPFPKLKSAFLAIVFGGLLLALTTNSGRFTDIYLFPFVLAGGTVYILLTTNVVLLFQRKARLVPRLRFQVWLTTIVVLAVLYFVGKFITAYLISPDLRFDGPQNWGEALYDQYFNTFWVFVNVGIFWWIAVVLVNLWEAFRLMWSADDIPLSRVNSKLEKSDQVKTSGPKFFEYLLIREILTRTRWKIRSDKRQE